jgi:uncharacterized protein
MARLIFFTLLVFIFYYLLRFLVKNVSFSKRKSQGEHEELVQDPYCQTYIPKQTALKKKVGGQEHYFCCDKCFKSYIRGEAKNNPDASLINVTGGIVEEKRMKGRD